MSLIASISSPINEISDSLCQRSSLRHPSAPESGASDDWAVRDRHRFDFAGAFYPLEKRVFRFLALPVTRSSFHDVGWYNLVACSGITFFTVAAGFYEMLLAVPLPGIRSIIGQTAIDTMLWHAIGGVAILLVIVAMTVWRGYQRFVWRKDFGRQVTWLYLLAGASMLVLMGLHGSLGAWLASDFGVHITADQLLAAGADLNEVLP